KLVEIDLATSKVKRVFALGPEIALPGSYIDDIRFHGDTAYLTDAGKPAIIVLDLTTGTMRRVLEGAPSTTASPDRPIIIGGAILKGPDGRPLLVHADPIEVSPDGEWLYYGTLEGPWSRIATRRLDDFTLSPQTIFSEVEAWADLPPVGGTAMDTN